MTVYSPYLTEYSTTTNGGDSDPYSFGIEIYATAQCWITHIHWFQAAGGSAKSTATRTGAVWQTDGAPYESGTNLSGTQSFPATVDGWNTLELATPVELIGSGSGVRYKIVVCHPAGGYSAISHYYDSGDGGTDTTFGPVVIPAASNTTIGQGSYVVGSSMAYPWHQFGSAFYGHTFTVTDVDPDAAPPAEPVVNAGGDITITLGQTAHRTATASGSPDTWAWSTTAGPGSPESIGTSATLSWTPATVGTYTVSVTATNAVGMSDPDTLTVTVNPPPPPPQTPGNGGFLAGFFAAG